MARKATFDRNEALKTAMELFWSKGFQGTSMKDLEAALDLKPGSIYAAFGSKEALYAEALTLYSTATSGQLQDLLAKADTPLSGLANHVRRLGNIKKASTPSNACMLVKTLLELPEHNQQLRHTTEELMRKTETIFREAFEKAKATGEIEETADVEFLAARIQSQIYLLRSKAERGDAEKLVPKLAETIAREVEALSTQS